MRFDLGMLCLALLLGVSPAVALDAFPSKPMRIIVGFPPGGGTDIVARILAKRLAENTGQPVVIENKGGANGVIGTDLAAKAAPDGYTMFLGTLGNLAANPSLYNNLPFNVGRDFAPITQVCDVWVILSANTSFPAKSVKEVIALAKARPGQVNYSTSGTGSVLHLAGAMFATAAGIKITHIPYKGSSPALMALLSGEVQLTVDTILQDLPYVKSGRVQPIAVLGSTRSPLLPNVPTMSETIPGFHVTNWFGLVVPSGTPPEVQARLHREVVKVLRAPETKEQLLALGAEPVGNSQEEFAAFLKSETEKWGKVIRDGNIKAQ